MAEPPSVQTCPSLSRSALAGLVATVALLVCAYLPSFSVPFFFDDRDAITNNPTIRNIWDLRAVLSPPNNGGGTTGRPLVNASLALNYAWSGNDVRSYHAFNLAVHGVATLAVFGILRRTFQASPVLVRFRPAGETAALIASMVWSLHPIQTESVSCVIQRTELLVSAFLLLTLYTFIRTVQAPASIGWKVAMTAVSAAGMASKEVMVTAPLLVLFFDRTFFAKSFRSIWQLRRSTYLLLGATLLVLAANLVLMGGNRGSAAGFGLGVPWWAYSLKQFEAIVIYLKLTFWPARLTLDYGDALVFDPVAVWWQAIVVLTLGLAALWKLRTLSDVGFLGLWFFAILAPSSSVVPLVTQTVAEHRVYLPTASLVILAVAAVYRLLGIATLRLAAAGALIALALSSYARNSLLADEVALWRDTVAKVPHNARAHDNLGLALAQRGRAAEAIPVYQRALALNPRSGPTHGMLGDAYLTLGRLPEAELNYRAALRLTPNQPAIANNLGVVLLRTGKLHEAISFFRQEVANNEQSAEGYRNLALSLAEAGETAAALEQFEAGLRRDPGYAPLHAGYAQVLIQAGRLEAAAARYEQALRLNPDDAFARNNAANLLIRLQRPAEALVHSTRALELRPDLSHAHNNHGLAHAMLGDLRAAATCFERAVTLNPEYDEARHNLERVQAALRATSASGR